MLPQCSRGVDDAASHKEADDRSHYRNYCGNYCGNNCGDQDGRGESRGCLPVTFRVVYDEDSDCILTTVSGDMDMDVVQAFFAEVGRVAAENRCTRVLSDLREAKIVAATADIYLMAKALGEKKISPSFKRAIVISRDEEDYAFWETVCFNQGFQNVRVFREYDEAKQWVLQK